MAKDAREDAAQSNVTDDTIAAAHRDFEDSLAALETAKGRHRATLKRLKGYGVDVGVLATVVSLKRRESDSVSGEYRSFVRYCRVLQLPLGTQLSFLGDELVGEQAQPERSEQSLEDDKLWNAGQAGGAAARNGEPASNNPYLSGSPIWSAWAEGYRRALATVLAPSPPRRRGRPRKVQPGELQVQTAVA